MGSIVTTLALIYTVLVFIGGLFSVGDIDRFWPNPMVPLSISLAPVWLLTAWAQNW